jgi:uncharacterized protein (TIGR02453 family)
MAKAAFTAFPEEGLRFLRSLKRNNNRDWFNRHKATYETALKRPMEELIVALSADFARFAPEMIATPKASSYRIYRDTRFSADKSPYKTHVAAVFPRSGLAKHEGAGFYLHVSPAEVLIGGGFYMPSPEDLQAVRMHIAENHAALRRVLRARAFVTVLGTLEGERLSRVPRGFAADHPAADFLRYKQFLAARTLPAHVSVESGFYGTVVETFRAIVPLVRFLNEPILEARRTRERKDAMLRS